MKSVEGRLDKTEMELADLLKIKISDKDRVLRKLSETIEEHLKNNPDGPEESPDAEIVITNSLGL